MSFLEEIHKQLNSYPIFKKNARIQYWEEYPLAQVHMDTMFFKVADSKESLIPILVIVDVATRYTKYIVQERKNDSLNESLKKFVLEVKGKFGTHSNELLLVTDGAPEFKRHIKDKIEDVSLKHDIVIKKFVSGGLNKAVLAETKIRQARAVLREFESILNINNMEHGINQKIDRDNIVEIMEIIEGIVNKKAKLREQKNLDPEKKIPEIMLGTPVFCINLYKFANYQMKDVLGKSSYKLNYYYEPFYVSKKVIYNGIVKYKLRSYTDDKELKYWFYQDELQKIDSRYSSRYIKAFVKNWYEEEKNKK